MLQQHYSLFDSFFAPTRVIVVSEERLKQAEREAMETHISAIDIRIEELTKYRTSLMKQMDPQSLEEALLGE